MTRKEQNKKLDAKIESNVNQYRVDRMNAEISAFSSGDLNKYEFLTRKDLKYKPNALDKARFQFSPLGITFSMGLDKTAQGYQEEGVMKLLKDIRDSLRKGGVRPLGPDDNDDDNDNNDDDNNDNDNNDDDNDDDNNDNDDNDNNDEEDIYDDLVNNLKDSELSNEEKYKIYKMLNKFKEFNKKSNDHLDIFNNKISTLNDKIFKTKDIIKNNEILTNAEKNELQNKIEIINKEKNDLQKYIKEITSQKNYINNENRKAVDRIKNIKNLKHMKII